MNKEINEYFSYTLSGVVYHYKQTKTSFGKSKLHRIDGPAIEYPSGFQEWFIDGMKISDIETFKYYSKITDEDLLILLLKYGNIK